GETRGRGGRGTGERPPSAEQARLGGEGEQGEGEPPDGQEGVIRGPHAADQRDRDEEPVPSPDTSVFALAFARDRTGPPARRQQRRGRDEQGVERVDALDVRLAPEARAGREERGRGDRRRAADVERAGREEEQRHRAGGGGRGEEAHAEGDR